MRGDEHDNTAPPQGTSIESTVIELEDEVRLESIREHFQSFSGPHYHHWAQMQSEVEPLITALSKRLFAQSRSYAREYGAKALAQLTDKNGMFLDEKGIRGELTNIDGKPVAKVVHEELDHAFIVVDLQTHTPSSRALREYVAVQHMDSGQSRGNNVIGRDVVFLWINNNQIIERTYLSKPWRFSMRWWKEYGALILKKPSPHHYPFGTFCGTAQASMALCVSGAHMLVDPSVSFDVKPAVLSFIFGTTIGIFVKTYRGWTLLGAKLSRTIKTSVVSYLFAFTLLYTGGKLASPVELAFWLATFHISLNATMNNWFKTECHNLNRIRERNRICTRPFRYYSYIKKEWVETKLSVSDIEYQSMYLVPFTIRLADLTHVSIPLASLTEAIPGIESLLGSGIPIGKALLWGSIPIAQYLVLKYSESRQLEGADKYRARFEKSKANVRKLLVAPLKIAEHSAKAGMQVIDQATTTLGIGQLPITQAKIATSIVKDTPIRQQFNYAGQQTGAIAVSAYDIAQEYSSTLGAGLAGREEIKVGFSGVRAIDGRMVIEKGVELVGSSLKSADEYSTTLGVMNHPIANIKAGISAGASYARHAGEKCVRALVRAAQ